jgi:hypothetical protein
MLKESTAREGSTLVGDKRLRNNAIVAAHDFVCTLGTKSLVSVEFRLEFDMDMVRCMIDKQASSRVHLIHIGLASRGEQPALG